MVCESIGALVAHPWNFVLGERRSLRHLQNRRGDCHDTHGHKDQCVTGAIFNYTMQLLSAYESTEAIVKYNLTEALMFWSHFIGDIHQPLHVGFLGDLGGNTITVHWYRQKTNLYHVWDDMIIDSALKTFYNSIISLMIQGLQSNLTKKQVKLFNICHNSKMEAVVPENSHVRLVAFNLGYLPGSNKSIITISDTTFSALQGSRTNLTSRWDH